MQTITTRKNGLQRYTLSDKHDFVGDKHFFYLTELWELTLHSKSDLPAADKMMLLNFFHPCFVAFASFESSADFSACK